MRNKTATNLVRSIFVFCAVLMMAGMASAHAPSNLELKYMPADGVLEVTAYHDIRNDKEETRKEHYIREYIVMVDGKEVERVQQTSQLDQEKSVAKINLPNVSKGSVIKVEAICNKTGINAESITVE